ncbi:DUF4251 domain-containing protein [Ulvibacter antarcticus]|uniref:Uncharacterized protein DUF4251 n=1 Tax=Ulvibacter antarcticus TaxID=442714 RepID=A0A3L9YWX3_9FLAO|nr:DUF4251 domain-containing protein [Ulvibacter antarcticus]RMA64300.1 uncharacterized protein DUF4251 [Ulvibacter antarcticus]
MKAILKLSVVLLILVGCKGSDGVVNSVEAQQTQAMLDAGNFEIDLKTANPLASNELNQLQNSGLLGVGNSAGRINLIGITSYLQFKGDNLKVYLPYYGTRRMGVTMGRDNGAIEFDGVPTDYKSTYNEQKGRTQIDFSMREGSENYDVIITIYPNRNAFVNINSSQRNSISYDGVVSELKEE